MGNDVHGVRRGLGVTKKIDTVLQSREGLDSSPGRTIFISDALLTPGDDEKYLARVLDSIQTIFQSVGMKDITINRTTNVIKGSYSSNNNNNNNNGNGDGDNDGDDDDILPPLPPTYTEVCKLAGRVVKDEKNFLFLEVGRRGGDNATFWDALGKIRKGMEIINEDRDMTVGEEVVDDFI